MRADVDVVVIGAGVMGAATARFLARAGREVVLLERFEIGHAHGSSHGAARIFRLSYADVRYVRMATEALPLWRELEEEAGERLLHPCVALNIGAGREALPAAMSAGGAAFEPLPVDEVARRHPGVRAHGPAIEDPAAAVIAADGTVRALVRSAVAHGTELRERVRATSITPRGDSVEIGTDGATLRARRVVVTAGAWARGLLAGAGIQIPTRPTRETVAYFRAPSHVPIVIEWTSPLVYSLPSFGLGVKVGEHIAGPTADPDEAGGPDGESVARVAAWVARRFPDADATPHAVETCLYTNTPDERFIIERRGPIIIGSACSGHGFKFAPLVGARLAALAG